jgi:hypothetical protein
MVTRIAPVALGVAVAATAGCMSALPAAIAPQAESLDAAQHIDLSKGAPAPAGFGKVTLKVDGLPQAFRKLQSFNTQGASLSIAVTKPGSHDFVVDASGTTALYEVNVTGSSATVTLPAMPNSKAAPTTSAPFYDPSSAYVFTTFLFRNDATATASVADVSNYGTATGTGFMWDKLWTDVDAYMADTSVAPKLLGSGSSRADVIPGLPVNVTVTNWAHVNGNFLTAAGNEATNSIIVTPTGGTSAGIATENGVTVLRVRMPGLDPATVTASGADRYVRASVTFGTTASAIKLTATTTDPSTGLPGVTLANNVTLSSTVPTSSNSTTTAQNAGRTHYTDIQMSGLTSGTRNIIDLKFTNFTAYQAVRLLPLNYAGILSNGIGKVNLD